MNAVTYCAISLINNAFSHPGKTAIVDAHKSYSYSALLAASGQVAAALMGEAADLHEAPIAFMIPSGFEYAAVQWGIWRAGGIAVPVSVSHPAAEVEYILDDTQCRAIVAHPEFEDMLRPLAAARHIDLWLTPEFYMLQPEARVAKLPEVIESRKAMIIYTSGTTSKPKGVVSTHANIRAQIQSLVEAWEWKSSDYILNVLPMHHVHGVINVLSCALWVGATCEMQAKFDAEMVWKCFIKKNITLFMAVPTIYNRLIECWDKADEAKKKQMSEACAKFRLMVSGSAALPVSVLEKWRTISGHTLLERYGMTEIGMALSNPLHGKRLPGFVGKPFPGIQVRLVDEHNHEITTPETPGEIQVKGATVFKEYWRKREATNAAFKDGWFLTGDIAVKDAEGNYRLLGRNSTDIIKTGGYKVSALEIEELLLTHPLITECAVVGIPDADWGERIAAAIVTVLGQKMDKEELRHWTKEKLAHYKVPTVWVFAEKLPRNAMGKVVKPEVKKGFMAVTGKH